MSAKPKPGLLNRLKRLLGALGPGGTAAGYEVPSPPAVIELAPKEEPVIPTPALAEPREVPDRFQGWADATHPDFQPPELRIGIAGVTGEPAGQPHNIDLGSAPRATQPPTHSTPADVPQPVAHEETILLEVPPPEALPAGPVPPVVPQGAAETARAARHSGLGGSGLPNGAVVNNNHHGVGSGGMPTSERTGGKGIGSRIKGFFGGIKDGIGGMFAGRDYYPPSASEIARAEEALKKAEATIAKNAEQVLEKNGGMLEKMGGKGAAGFAVAGAAALGTVALAASRDVAEPATEVMVNSFARSGQSRSEPNYGLAF